MRRRVIFLAAGTALLAVVLLALPLGALAARGYLRDERLELQQAAATAAAGARGDITAAPAPHVDSSEIQLSVYDRSGRRRSGPGPATAGRLVRAALGGQQASAMTDDAISVTAPVSDGDQVVAALLLSTSLDAVHQRSVRAWLALAGMCFAAVVVSAVVARLVATRLTAPVYRLTEIARRVGSGDLSARAERSGVAELDTLGGALNDTVERIDTMIDRERAFSAEVSHQLRTPLSGLRLELEEARRGIDAGSSALAGLNDVLTRAITETDRLDATITDVISLARDLPTGRQVALSTVLHAVSQRWHAPLALRSRPLRVTADPFVEARLPISEAAATQVLDVLLENAYVHGRGAVTVRFRQTDGAVAIDVSDEGPALTREPHDLFGKRDKTTAERPLHGIGLPFARKLAEAEGARLVLAAGLPPTFSLLVPTASSDSTT